MAERSGNTRRVDPYRNFKFRIKWDGRHVAGLSKCDSFKTSIGKGQAITLERGVTHDPEFEIWANKVRTATGPDADGGLKDFRKDILLEVYDEAGQMALAYTIDRCWVSRFQAMPDLDASANAIAIESLTLEHEGWKKSQLHEIVTQIRKRAVGIAVLFTGSHKTRKTMAAEFIADELGSRLVRVDLSQVISQYIGETEKNLRRVFDAAESTASILFFDEADALFGKSTDANDRYTNLEILLKRIDRFKGLAILATNRKGGLDPALVRRFRFVIEFCPPTVA